MDIQISNALEYIYNALTTHEAIKKHGSAVMGYVSLFGVTPFQIRALKFRRIMEEMVKLFDSQSFSYKKKLYKISHAGIIEAIDVCIKKNFTDVLENHNYLKKVMIDISEREGKAASIRAERDLRQNESNATARGMHRATETPQRFIDPDGDREDVGEDLSPITQDQAKQNLTRVRNLLGGLAK
ncbi:MAG: hypothetical protein LLG40_11285 [Deltaproteobacteria bacterium]|nr:hypothetical protein [Deltaproteobacteria bacterium]